MLDYIPAADSQSDAWQQNFITYTDANLAAFGFVAGALTLVTNAQTQWVANYPAHTAA